MYNSYVVFKECLVPHKDQIYNGLNLTVSSFEKLEQ